MTMPVLPSQMSQHRRSRRVPFSVGHSPGPGCVDSVTQNRSLWAGFAELREAAVVLHVSAYIYIYLSIHTHTYTYASSKNACLKMGICSSFIVWWNTVCPELLSSGQWWPPGAEHLQPNASACLDVSRSELSCYPMPFLIFLPLFVYTPQVRGRRMLTSLPKISQGFHTSFHSGELWFGGFTRELPGHSSHSSSGDGRWLKWEATTVSLTTE